MKTRIIIIAALAVMLSACNNNSTNLNNDEVLCIIAGAWQLNKVVSDGRIQHYEDGTSKYISEETTQKYSAKEYVMYFENVDSCSRWTFSDKTNQWENLTPQSILTYNLSGPEDSIMLTISSVDKPQGDGWDCGTPVITKYKVKSTVNEIREDKILILESSLDYIMTSDHVFHTINRTSYFTREYTLGKYLKNKK